MPPHIYITVLEDLYNTAQMFVSKYGTGHSISISRLRYSANHTHWIAVQAEHTAFYRTMSFVKMHAFQNGGAEWSNNTVQYVENNGLVAQTELRLSQD